MTNPTRITSLSAQAARSAGIPTRILPAGHDGRREAQPEPLTPFEIVAEDSELVLKAVGMGNGSVLVVKDKQTGQVSITYVPTPA